MKRAWIILASLVLAANASAAPVPGHVPFTARLSDANGPITGTVSLTFSVFDVATGGAQVWTETYGTASATNGLVFVDLGSQTTLDSTVLNGGTQYLEVSVNGTTMTPRLPIGSAPYAIHAGTSDYLGTYAQADVQARVTGTCSNGAVSAIDSTGGVTCVSVGQTYTGMGGVAINGSNQVSLATTGCSSGYVWKFNGAAFACAPDANTLYTGSDGVAVNGTTISLDTTGCSAGYAWTYNGSAFTCAPQQTYTAGTGISIASNVVSLATPVAVADGGTGATTATGAVDALLPPQTSNANDVLTTDGSNPSWATVRSVLAAGDNNGLVVRGTLTGAAGSELPSGAGVRMVWYPQRAAFRAGSVNSTQWDDANIGMYSLATGYVTIASQSYTTALGYASTATAYGATAMGVGATASGTDSTAMGNATTASGNYSTAMGYTASTNLQNGAFVYGDNSTNTVMNAPAPNSFTVRAAGGVTFYTNSGLTAGVSVGAGAGTWSSVSDRNAKQDFEDIDGEAVLDKLAHMSIQSWRYKTEVSRARHVGPVAQDFYAAFGLGDSDKKITSIDEDGIALLAIQTLAKKAARDEQRAAALEQRSAELARDNAELRARLAAVEQTVRRLEHVNGAAASKR